MSNQKAYEAAVDVQGLIRAAELLVDHAQDDERARHALFSVLNAAEEIAGWLARVIDGVDTDEGRTDAAMAVAMRPGSLGGVSPVCESWKTA